MGKMRKKSFCLLFVTIDRGKIVYLTDQYTIWSGIENCIVWRAYKFVKQFVCWNENLIGTFWNCEHIQSLEWIFNEFFPRPTKIREVLIWIVKASHRIMFIFFIVIAVCVCCCDDSGDNKKKWNLIFKYYIMRALAYNYLHCSHPIISDDVHKDEKRNNGSLAWQ